MAANTTQRAGNGEAAVWSASLAELKARKQLTHVTDDGLEILLVMTSAGVRAYNGVCPHLGGPLLEGTFSNDTIVCPWHDYAFDAVTGHCKTIPGRKLWKDVRGAQLSQKPYPIPMVTLGVAVDGDVVSVYRGKGRAPNETLTSGAKV